MKKIIQRIDISLEWLGISFLILLFVCTITQVFFRYILNNPLPWPEEFGCYFFIWITYIGLIKNIRENNYFRIDFIMLKLSEKNKTILNFIFNLLILCFLVVTFLGSIELLRTNRHILSANLMPVNIVYSSLPVLSVFMIVHVIIYQFNALSFLISGKRTDINQ